MVAKIQVNNLLLVVLKIFFERATLFKLYHHSTYCNTMRIKTCTRTTPIYFCMVLAPKLLMMPSFPNIYFSLLYLLFHRGEVTTVIYNMHERKRMFKSAALYTKRTGKLKLYSWRKIIVMLKLRNIWLTKMNYTVVLTTLCQFLPASEL